MNNVLLSYIRRLNRSGRTVEKVIKMLSENPWEVDAKLKKFYAYQNYLKNNANDFIIREAIKGLMNH